jgi:hypothetical protein
MHLWQGLVSFWEYFKIPLTWKPPIPIALK